MYWEATSQPLMYFKGRTHPKPTRGTEISKWTQNGGSNRTCSHTTKNVSGKATIHREKNAWPSSGAAKP